jgi:hypothetical protein
MFTKTSIALAIIVAISSGALAAQKQAPSGAFSSPHYCGQTTTWDQNALRCD